MPSSNWLTENKDGQQKTNSTASLEDPSLINQVRVFLFFILSFFDIFFSLCVSLPLPLLLAFTLQVFFVYFMASSFTFL